MSGRNINSLLQILSSCMEVLNITEAVRLEVDVKQEKITLHKREPDPAYESNSFIKIIPYPVVADEWMTGGIVSSNEIQIAATAVSNFIASQVREEIFGIFQDLKGKNE